MKLVSYELQGKPSFGVVEGDNIIDIGLSHPELGSLKQAIAAGAGGEGQAEAHHTRASWWR
jgi:hypothetical protein